MKLYFTNGSISNRFIYNQEEKIIINNAYSFEYKKDDLNLKLNYTSILNKDDLTNLYKDGINNKSVSLELSDKIYKYYTLNYTHKYDLTNSIINSQRYGLRINKKCWDLDISYTDSLIATATETENAVRQKIIYTTITLKPIVSIEQKYIKDERDE